MLRNLKFNHLAKRYESAFLGVCWTWRKIFALGKDRSVFIAAGGGCLLHCSWPAAMKIIDAGLLGQFLLKPHDLREQHSLNSAIETQNRDVVLFQPARGH